MSVNSSDSTVEIARVSVKVPPFWRGNPAIWFAQLEFLFINSGITQSSSYGSLTTGHKAHLPGSMNADAAPLTSSSRTRTGRSVCFPEQYNNNVLFP
ncbi:hypothetical protein TNCV_4864951 [Trichonephila clavipes]|nr:hypothetical protein TNCV_4864951 [Trichonephila clavipes]